MQVRHRQHTPPSTSFPQYGAYRVPQPCNLDGISMNIHEENSIHYFRVQSEREQTLVLATLTVFTLCINKSVNQR